MQDKTQFVLSCWAGWRGGDLRARQPALSLAELVDFVSYCVGKASEKLTPLTADALRKGVETQVIVNTAEARWSKQRAWNVFILVPS